MVAYVASRELLGGRLGAAWKDLSVLLGLKTIKGFI